MGALRPVKESALAFLTHLQKAKILPGRWKSSFAQIHWVLVSAVVDQVEIIVCDANLFTNRQFKSDRHSNPDTGSVRTILDQILVSANKLREPHHRIAYNFELSTLATEQLAASAGQDADVDCLTQIVLNYGKDMHTLVKRSSDIPEDMGRIEYEGPPRQKETLIKVNEHLRHLNHLDFCLKSSDHDYHHPFQCTFQLAAKSNVQVRSDTSARY